MIRIKSHFIALILAVSSLLNLNAQVSHELPTAEQKLVKGIDLFEQQLYGSAIQVFEEIIAHHTRVGFNDISTDAEFYAAVCALKLSNSDAEYRIVNFIKRNPESPRIQRACFFMGQHKYSQENWENSVYWFGRVERYLLEREERAEYYFKQGYAWLMLEEEEKANKLFYELLEYPESDYYGPGVYYYSHIEYTRGNYETAYKGFNALKEDPTFSPVVPYYLAHIFFLQDKYEKVIEYVPGIIEKVTPKRKAEMQRMLGNAWFKQKNYDSAQFYLEKYKASTDNLKRYDIYQLAFSYFQTNQYEKAAENFSMVTNKNDSLAQNANYHLAASYLKLDDKTNAHLAFGSASRMSFNEKIKEDALFNYAKLTYELSFAPFDETIRIFHSYLDQYNNTSRSDMIYNYLVDVYMNSKNYEQAIQSIEKIKQKNKQITNALQKVTFYRGIELYNNLKYSEAIDMFNKSLQSEGNEIKFTALAKYWKAESYFRKSQYDIAINTYKNFLTTPGAFSSPYYNLTNYNIAYAFFKQAKYNDASIWFRKYLEDADSTQTKINYDASVRLGDSYFVQRKYNQALPAYAAATKIASEENDYAIFQEGFTAGILRKHQEKIDILDPLTLRSISLLADDAVFEQGQAFIQLNQPEKGAQKFEYLIANFPKSNYLKKSHLQAGLMYFNMEENEKAAEHFKLIIENYKGSDEYAEALITLKNVYLDQNRVDDFFAYAKDKQINISSNEQDSLLYLSAEKAYLNGENEQSTELFNNYLSRFADGQFTLKAHFYLAQTLFNDEKYDDAISHYEYVISQAQNSFTETALYNLANISRNNNRMAKAWEYFNQLEPIASNQRMLLESRIGQMRAAMITQEYDKAETAASQVLITEKVPDEIAREARMNKARALEKLGKTNDALTQYRLTAQNLQTKEGAEAKYKVAQLVYEEGKTALAEAEIQEFIKKGTPHQYWLGKSFLLFSKILVETNKSFQAKAYLQSIIDNYMNKEDGIIEEAKEQLKTISSSEEEKFKSESEEIELELNKETKVDTTQLK
jgi:TolA-binding protein